MAAFSATAEVLDKVRAIAQPVVEALEMELVHLELKPSAGGLVLRLYIDRSGGVNLEDCATVSRQVSAHLDVEDPISARYTLEVSSPGLDRPLVSLRDFVRFTGRSARISTKTPFQGQRNFHGVLAGVIAGAVQLTLENGTVVAIPQETIAKARLDAQFDEPHRRSGARGRNA